MRSACSLLVVLIIGSGCVAVDDRTVTPEAASGDARPITHAYGTALTDLADTENDICSLLPADGPCALACDEDALAEQYVPAGACAAFSCTLTDGREIAVHACHIGD